MHEHRVSLPEIILIAATRGMIGFGAGLLISDRLSRDRRITVGWALFATGLLSTIPLGVRLFRRRRDGLDQPTRGNRSEPMSQPETQLH